MGLPAVRTVPGRSQQVLPVLPYWQHFQGLGLSNLLDTISCFLST